MSCRIIVRLLEASHTFSGVEAFMIWRYHRRYFSRIYGSGIALTNQFFYNDKFMRATSDLQRFQHSIVFVWHVRVSPIAFREKEQEKGNSSDLNFCHSSVHNE